MMLNQFPNLLLSDRLTPITNEIGLVELPFEDALKAYVDWQQVYPGWIICSAVACLSSRST